MLLAVPFSLVGAFWFLYLLHYNMSVAVWVGLIALAGLDAETGVVMLLYLDHAWDKFRAAGRLKTPADLHDAIVEGAVQRIRPKIMTVCAILFGLLPIMWSPDDAGRGGRDEAHRRAHDRRRRHLGRPGAPPLPRDLHALEAATSSGARRPRNVPDAAGRPGGARRPAPDSLGDAVLLALAAGAGPLRWSQSAPSPALEARSRAPFATRTETA